MITKKDSQYLKAISEDDHAKDIARELNEEGVRPQRSEKYISRTITRIMRGEQNDINAELAIYKYYHELDKKKKELEELKKKNSTDLAIDQIK